jgi:hypothetical protein
MKKLVSMLFVTAMLGMVFTSCGKDDPDEPVIPTTQLESEHGLANDTYLIYDIDLSKDSSTIYVYNAVFTMGEAASPALNISVNSPCTVDKTGKVFTFRGTNIVPNLMRGNNPVPFPTLRVNNLTSVVNVEKKTYSISFDCQGTAMGKEIDGHYDKEGKLK